MDELLLGQHFRDEHRFFKVDEFRQRVKPLIEAIENDDEIDTSMFTVQQLYALAISVGKKRDQYVPKKKQKLSQQIGEHSVLIVALHHDTCMNCKNKSSIASYF